MLVAVTAAVVATLLLRSNQSSREGEVVEKENPETAVRSSATQAPEIAVHDETTGNVVSSDAPPLPSSIRQQFLASNDYSVFTSSIFQDAKSGNKDAQYYLYAAMSYCEREFRGLFRRRGGGGWLTLDEALSRVAGRRAESLAVTELVDQRCRKLMEGRRTELGASDEWLQRAAASGQPIALASLADSRLIDESSNRPAKKLMDFASSLETMSVRDMLKAALVSKDPEVIWKIGEMQGLLGGSSEESRRAYWAWMLAACVRGYECGPENPWVEYSCRFDQLCQPNETAVDIMKRTLQTDFAAVEELAHEINSKIDAEAWSELPIG